MKLQEPPWPISISSFIAGPWNTATSRLVNEPCAPAWRKSEGRELYDESVTVVGSERQQGELRRLICKNRIMLVHRIERWAPCFLSAVTEGLHQEVAGVSQTTVSTSFFNPPTLSTKAADRADRPDPLLYLMQSSGVALSSQMPLKLVWPHSEKRVRECSKWNWNVANFN